MRWKRDWVCVPPFLRRADQAASTNPPSLSRASTYTTVLSNCTRLVSSSSYSGPPAKAQVSSSKAGTPCEVISNVPLFPPRHPRS